MFAISLIEDGILQMISKVLYKYCMQQHRNFTTVAKLEQNRHSHRTLGNFWFLCRWISKVASCSPPPLGVFVCFTLFVLFGFKCLLIFRLLGSCPVALGLILLSRVGTLSIVSGSLESLVKSCSWHSETHRGSGETSEKKLFTYELV